MKRLQKSPSKRVFKLRDRPEEYQRSRKCRSPQCWRSASRQLNNQGSLLKCMDCLIAPVRTVVGCIVMSWRTRASFAPLSLTKTNQRGAAQAWIRIRRPFNPEQTSLSATDAETFWRGTCLTNRLYLTSHKYCAVERMNKRVLFQPSCSVGQYPQNPESPLLLIEHRGLSISV